MITAEIVNIHLWAIPDILAIIKGEGSILQRDGGGDECAHIDCTQHIAELKRGISWLPVVEDELSVELVIQGGVVENESIVGTGEFFLHEEKVHAILDREPKYYLPGMLYLVKYPFIVHFDHLHCSLVDFVVVFVVAGWKIR